MKIIKTGQTRSDAKRQWDVMVDDADYEFLVQFNWQVDRYSTVSTHGNKDQRRVLIHRLILNPCESLEVDHIDGNRLNNQRFNLRLATSSENKMNRGGRKDNKLGLKGVIWNKARNRFQSNIQIPGGKYLHLGSFGDKYEAALAYNKASKKYHGEFAFQNQLN